MKLLFRSAFVYQRYRIAIEDLCDENSPYLTLDLNENLRNSDVIFDKIPAMTLRNVVYVIYHIKTMSVVYVGSTSLSLDKRYPDGWYNDPIHKTNKKEKDINPDEYDITPIIYLGNRVKVEELRELEAQYVKHFETYKYGWNQTPNGQYLNDEVYKELKRLQIENYTLQKKIQELEAVEFEKIEI